MSGIGSVVVLKQSDFAGSIQNLNGLSSPKYSFLLLRCNISSELFAESSRSPVNSTQARTTSVMSYTKVGSEIDAS